MSDLLTIPRPAARGDWLAVRKPFANASDAAVYMGCHPFKTLADLTVEKLADTVEEKTSRAMERGNRLEAAVVDWWADEHGVSIYEPPVLYACGRLLATLDRRIIGNDREAVEVKTTNRNVNEVEPYWWWQAQAQMHCADLDRIHFAVLDGTMDLSSYPVDRDDDAIGELVVAVEKVWSFLDLGMAPEGCEFTAKQVASMHPQPAAGALVDVGDDEFSLIVEWEQLRQARLRAEAAEDEVKDRVARLIAEREGARYGGSVVCTWKANKPSEKLDVRALEAAEPELVARFKRMVPGPRVLRFVGGDAA